MLRCSSGRGTFGLVKLWCATKDILQSGGWGKTSRKICHTSEVDSAVSSNPGEKEDQYYYAQSTSTEACEKMPRFACWLAHC